MSQGKYWVFTNFDLSLDYKELNYKYIIFGKEVCPKTNNVHHQGYIEFDSNIRLNKLKKFDNKIHWELRKGTQAEAITYCKKDNDWIEFGTKFESKQGARTDISNIRDIIRGGGRMNEVIEECNSYQSAKFGELYLKYKEPKRDWVCEVYWYYGPTGTGKTKLAYEQAGKDCWISLNNGKWFDGYDGEENVILDDFRGDWCTYTTLLRLLDRYPYRVEVKGGSRSWLAKRIWITSAYSPEETYQNVEDKQQLIRRLTEIKYFK